MMQFLKCFTSAGQSRRRFLRTAATSTLVSGRIAQGADTNASVLGRTPGYSPQIGTLVSEMTWIRDMKVLRSAKGLTPDQLDFLLDNKANRIGALLLHLAATESSIS
jgi:hypothetical protein